MKILTVGASPYLLVRNGKMHADIIEALVKEGHEVTSAVWHHDEGYFMPAEGGVHLYEKNGKTICNLHPFMARTEEASPFVYELMRKVKPEIILTVGDYKDTNFVFAIKAMYPTLFKWIAIYTFDCLGINPSAKDAFEYVDYVISTSNTGWNELSLFANVEGEFCPYGPDHQIFKQDTAIENRNISFLCSARNSQSSNLPAFMDAASRIVLNSRIHTNLYDAGDYNLDYLKEKYRANCIELPQQYCSIKDGLSDNEMCKLYNESKFIVDCSLKSATSLSLLEAMATGCIPIGTKYGRMGEIISMMPERFRYFVSYNTFVGQNEEQFAIISTEDLYLVLMKVSELSEEDLQKASKSAIEIAKNFSNTAFIDNLKQVIKNVSFAGQTLALDSI